MDGPDIFTPRGISDEVRDARPYLRYTRSNPEAAKRPWADDSRAERAHITKIVNQSDGWVITRHPPAMDPPLPPIYPELRPDNKVKTRSPLFHYHGSHRLTAGELAEWARSHGRLTDWLKTVDAAREGFDPDGEPPGRRIDVGDPSWKMWQAHIHRDKDDDDDHRGVNSEEPHQHQRYAKYVFGLEKKKDGSYEHDHADYKRAKARQDHVDRRHGGMEPGEPHEHIVGKVRDRQAPKVAARIDVHPFAVQRILSDSVVFFVIEGCLKADSVLTAGGAVFSVPSVSLWDCDELEKFAHAYLIDRRDGQSKVVVIVPDADWAGNPQVANEARMCEARLRQMSISEVHIAAPPARHNGVGTKGVDDFLGPASGGQLSDLLVIDNKPPDGLDDFIARIWHKAKRQDAAARDEWALRSLVTYCAPSGEVGCALRTLTRLMGMNNPMRTWRALGSLREVGALEVEGDILDREPKPNPRAWPSQALVFDWWDHPRPVMTLAADLRPTHTAPGPLGDVVKGDLRWMTCNCSTASAA